MTAGADEDGARAGGVEPVILLAGAPGSGKTTALQRLADLLGEAAGGFLTLEVRAKRKRRGFDIVTLDGERAPLARRRTPGASDDGPRVGAFSVDLAAVNRVAVPAVKAAAESGKIVVVDEIGPMELLSPEFRSTIAAVFDDPRVTLVGTVVHRAHDFADALKARSRVRLLKVDTESREALPEKIYRDLADRARDCGMDRKGTAR